MKAEDTVIKIEDIQDLWIPCETCHREPFWRTQDTPTECMECIALKHREAQAEISFKAGIKEVVEFDKDILSHILQDGGGNWSIESWLLMAFMKKRQAQLKTWGL